MVIMSPYRAKIAKLFCIIERRKKLLLRQDQLICDAACRQLLELVEADASVTQQIREHGHIRNLARRKENGHAV